MRHRERPEVLKLEQNGLTSDSDHHAEIELRETGEGSPRCRQEGL